LWRSLDLWLAVVIGASTAAGCSGSSDPAPATPPPAPDLATSPEKANDVGKMRSVAPELGLTAENFPELDASTSAQPLLMMMVCKILAVSFEWIHVQSDDSRQVRAQRFEKLKPLLKLSLVLEAHGTGEAYRNLIKKKADLILVARMPSGVELKLAGELAVELDAQPVALDGFVFLLNRKNPVTGLTIEQIRDIYSGRIVNWKVLGGPDEAIRPYQRITDSGSQELMKSLVMRERAMIKAPDLLIGAVMSHPFLKIDKDSYGIGYSVFYYQEFMAPSGDVKACAVEGVLPTSESIRSRRYPLVTDVYVVIRRDIPADHPARRLRDWMLGPTGQRIVEESGYVPAR
jgi:phosphate transport system substrate-binding protein